MTSFQLIVDGHSYTTGYNPQLNICTLGQNFMSTNVPVVNCDCPVFTAISLLLSVELTFCESTYKLLWGNFNCEENRTDSGLLPDTHSAYTILCVVGQSLRWGVEALPTRRGEGCQWSKAGFAAIPTLQWRSLGLLPLPFAILYSWCHCSVSLLQKQELQNTHPLLGYALYPMIPQVKKRLKLLSEMQISWKKA